MTKIENPRTGDFILSLASGNRSIDNVVLAEGNAVSAGSVVAQLTAGGKWVTLRNAAGDDAGSNVAKGVALSSCDATDADMPLAVVVRDAEVKADALVFLTAVSGANQTAAKKALAALGVISR